MAKNRGTGYAETESLLAALDGDMGDCSTWLAGLSPAEHYRLEAALDEMMRRVDRLLRIERKPPISGSSDE